MTPESIVRLYDYNYWAFERVWTCIEQITDEQFVKPLGYSRGSIRDQVVHLMSATRRWVERLQLLEASPHLAFEDFPSKALTKTTWDQMRADVLCYIRSLDQAQLDEVVQWEISSRALTSHSPRWELLLHVANHGTDHRAQILAMLHEHFRVATIEQDMVFYLVEAE